MHNIYIYKSVLDLIDKFKQVNVNDNESGGVVLGQVVGNDVYILRVSIPNKFDNFSRYSFTCNKDAAQVIIEYEFYNSQNKTIYIGEWHTHPEKKPYPSGIDIEMIKSQYKKNKLNEPFFILIIKGIKDLYVGLFDGCKLMKMNYIIIDDI